MTVRDRVREALAKSKESDPTIVVQRLVLRLTPEERDEAVRIGLDYIARNENQLMRSGEPQRVGRSRRLIANERECVNGTWLNTDDYTYELLIAKAEEYEAESSAMLAHATARRELASELKASGCATLGEMRKKREP